MKDYSIIGEDADLLRKAYAFVEESFPDIKDKKKMDELIKYVYRLFSLFGESAGIKF